MFPFVRMIKDTWLASRQPPFKSLTETHVSHHICWPHDLDFWLELNNGRAMSLYDLGRMGMAQRGGLIRILRRERWGMTMAGVSTRFRRRIHGFERFEMRSRTLCWDDKFIYLEQSMWKKNGECASHVLFRSAVTDKNGLVTPDRVLAALGQTVTSPPMPDWVAAWCAADAQRPWPPMQTAIAPPSSGH
ncbi:thioesterase family protein [Sulfitobacter mediterraneus]|uniref:Thioeseterase n=1 Tax=Sulfitobacter mediterraneus TaxID=83219 RepID=A0A061SV02_9RHOB|nr:acyl-CoA thioesterase [Sulfitobacter mediterraneus]KAJ03588.1 thioeseterase [Sulfitobacter mediterraneus]MBM1555197.1 thioesterase family protein [Sulfitobacter mediterraneus]MBM1567250.1 thioesterase family protein [Sulfitobacter mediterraneus]MBM1571052.1 thioesterase family protein [Sulfitobacter mediterraneus]MBM1574852.1 thioesterase family protein [Sulfitobacter mediterraneus]